MIARSIHDRPRRGQQMRIVEDAAELRRLITAARRQGRTITFVPTMGALHEGHMTLMRRAAYDDDNLVVASVFINPTQFGPTEDLSRYPRDVRGDAEKSAAAGVDVLFMPDLKTMYPFPDTQTWVNVSGLSQDLCGRARPTHFRGVATVVAKLFNIVQPDEAFFGEKDYQQLCVIRRMVTELMWPIRVVSVETIREPDGLAMSSRNAYLTPEQRAQAPSLYQALRDARQRFSDGLRCRDTLTQHILDDIHTRCPLGTLDYLDVVDPLTLSPAPSTLPDEALIALAVQVGRARLIDNILLQSTPAP
jgi:pantoate--beta-alanine ligase